VSFELGVGYELLSATTHGTQQRGTKERDVRIALRFPLRVIEAGDHVIEIVPEVATLWGWTDYKYDAQGNTLNLAGPGVRVALRYAYALRPDLWLFVELGARAEFLSFSPGVVYFDDGRLFRGAVPMTLGAAFAP
jgi:hypothetical protein